MSNNKLTSAVHHMQVRLEMMLDRHSLNEIEFTFLLDWEEEVGQVPNWKPQKTGLIKPTLEELAADPYVEMGKQQHAGVCSEVTTVVHDFREMVGPVCPMYLTARLAREGSVYPMRYQLRLRTFNDEEVQLNTLVTSG